MKRALFVSLIFLVLSGTLCLTFTDRRPAKTIYHAVEMKGQLVGYMEFSFFPAQSAESPTIETMSMILRLKALGQDFDVIVGTTRTIDPATGKTLRVETDLARGEQKGLGSTFVFEGDDVHVTPQAGGTTRTVHLGDEVILEDSLRYAFVLRDLKDAEGASKTYRVLEFMSGEVHEKTFTSKGAETLRLGGREIDCAVFAVVDRDLGLASTLWIEKSTARSVRTETASGFVSYLADKTVKAMDVRGDLDGQIFADVNLSIPDFKAITYMKVRAEVHSVGEWITAESLNVPGQKFVGTVEENFIDGLFEIEHPRYGGRGAPPFPPPDFSGDETLREYLEPEDLVESDDPVLIAKAEALTAGAKDSWDAAVRLCRFVSDEIVYEVPGGSARHTYDTRRGECGSHARLLTALCRGVGIPARVVGGCMYVPSRGGSFGQHGWNEVYMGDAGWITVDSTVKEIDFVDSGHIRLGVNASFNPRRMEILDYKAGALAMGEESDILLSMGKVPYEVGKSYTFKYTAGGKEIGREILTVKSFDQTISGGVYSCECRVKFPGNLSALIEFQLDHDGFPISFDVDADAQGKTVTIECVFTEGKVVEKIVQGQKPVEQTVDLTEKVRLISNNNVSLLAFLALSAPKEEGKVRSFTAFHPPSMQVFPGQVTNKGTEVITCGGREVECSLLDFSLVGTPIQIWIDSSGLLIREEEQGGAVKTELVHEE